MVVCKCGFESHRPIFRKEGTMPDITMCRDAGCRDRNRCWRFTAKPDPYWQSYFVETPREPGCEGCEYFWPIKNNSPDKE